MVRMYEEVAAYNWTSRNRPVASGSNRGHSDILQPLTIPVVTSLRDRAPSAGLAGHSQYIPRLQLQIFLTKLVQLIEQIHLPF